MRQTRMTNHNGLERKWYIIDAEGQTLGRLSTQIARILIGKNKPIYTPHVDCGDYIIVINVEKIHLSGKKWSKKNYYHHSQYPGGLKIRKASQIRDSKPEFLLERAVRLMLPKNKLGRKIYKKLFVYKGTKHKHDAQNPQKLIIEKKVNNG